MPKADERYVAALADELEAMKVKLAEVEKAHEDELRYWQEKIAEADTSCGGGTR